MYSDSFGYQLRRAQHAFRVALDAELRDIGLSLAQYAALAALKQHPDASNAELARLCFVTPQTMNELLAALVKDRLVQRLPHPDHGRLIRLRLTGKGGLLLGGGDRVARDVERRMLAGTNRQEQVQILELFKRFVDSLSVEASPTGP